MYDAGELKVQSIWKKTKRFLASEDGPTAVEYAVMLALIAGTVIASVQAMATATGSSFNKSAAAMFP
jgi:pilus assembly protein Flp/PilA